jgi:hypothetical protein
LNERPARARGGWSIAHGERILDVYTPRGFKLAKAMQDKRRRHRPRTKV